VCSKENSDKTAQETSKLLTQHWPEIKEQIGFLGRYLTKWNLVKAISILSESRKSRFLRRRTPKYGSMRKAFTEEELERFFNVIDDPKYHLLFSFQATMGLRIGEAIRVNIKDINLRTRELRIFTEKSRKTDYLLIPIKLFDRTVKYIDQFQEEIAKAKGFLFFSFTKGRRTKDTEPRITTETAGSYFQRYIKKAKLEEIYGYSSSPIPRPLYRLTPHSLRHYSITNFCRANNGNIMLAAKFARHQKAATTMIYLHTDKDELYQSIERANNNDRLKRIREMQEDIELSKTNNFHDLKNG
jgi:integrase